MDDAEAFSRPSESAETEAEDAATNSAVQRRHALLYPGARLDHVSVPGSETRTLRGYVSPHAMTQVFTICLQRDLQ